MERAEWIREEIEQLITEYEARPLLWDVLSVDYRNRIKKAETWTSLAEKMGKEVAEVQRKMHNLRNQFNQELKKKSREQKSGQGTDQTNSNTYTTKWPYFQALMFIKNGLLTRKSAGNLVSTTNFNYCKVTSRFHPVKYSLSFHFRFSFLSAARRVH